MDEQQKEELKRKITILMEESQSQQFNTRGGYVDLRRLEYYLHQLINELPTE